MRNILSDVKIAELLQDPKPLLKKQVEKLKTKFVAENKSRVSKLSVVSAGNMKFEITARGDARPDKAHKFSVILGYTWKGDPINLIRCNGPHGPHTNTIERALGAGVVEIPRDTYHIHFATERYQRVSEETDAEFYAEPTTEYDSLEGAVEYMCDHFGFYRADDSYPKLHPLFP